MAAISDSMMQSALDPWFGLHGQTVKIQTGADAGKLFEAVLLIAAPLVFQGEVVQDNREGSTVTFRQASFPDCQPADEFTDESGQRWRFGKRTNNPVDSTTEFEIVKITESDN